MACCLSYLEGGGSENYYLCTLIYRYASPIHMIKIYYVLYGTIEQLIRFIKLWTEPIEQGLEKLSRIKKAIINMYSNNSNN